MAIAAVAVVAAADDVVVVDNAHTKPMHQPASQSQRPTRPTPARTHALECAVAVDLALDAEADHDKYGGQQPAAER